MNKENSIFNKPYSLNAKFLFILLLTTISSLIFAGFLVYQLLQETMQFSYHKEMQEELKYSIDLYKENFKIRKQLYKSQAEEIRTKLLSSVNEASSIELALKDLNLDNFENLAKIKYAGKTYKFNQSKRFSKTQSFILLIDDEQQSSIEIIFGLPSNNFTKLENTKKLANLIRDVRKEIEIYREKYTLGFVIYMGFILGIVVLIANIFTRRLVQRFRAVTTAMKKLEAGDLDAKVMILSDDEIDDLGKSFNHMVERLKLQREKISYLEKVSSWQDVARKLAHEIKNPLTPIQLASQELKVVSKNYDERIQKVVNEVADIIDEEVGSLKQLVNQFSEFGKMPQAKTELLSLNEFIKDFMRTSPQWKPETIKLNLKTEDDLNVKIDKLHLRRVFNNLISNSVEASLKKGQKAKIIISTFSNQTDTVSISFEDDGPGINAEEIGKVFDPYFTTKPSGTGLGLSIVKLSILQQKGNIRVKNNETKGCRFTIEFPRFRISR